MRNLALKKNQSSHYFALGTVIIWASTYVFTKVALTYFTAFSLGVLRYIIASIALLIVAIIKRIGLPKIKDIPKFFFSGSIGFFLYMIAFNIGSGTLSPATGSIIIATVPISTACFASFFLKERLKIWCWVAIGIEFMGILLLTLWNGVFSINIGIIWMLGASLLLSGYNLTQRQYTKEYSAFQSTIYSIIAGTLLLCLFLPEAISQIINAPAKQILIIVYLGLFPSAISYIWWSKALSIARRTSDVSNYMFITPLLSMIFGYIVILEIPDVSTFVGGAVILLGLVLFSIVNKKEDAQVDVGKHHDPVTCKHHDPNL